MAKAQYHLQVGENLQAENFHDWAIIAYYAGMYMAAKAFTSSLSGKASKDHGCTIALMLSIIKGEKLSNKLEKIRKKFEREIELLSKVRQYRNTAVYNVTTVSKKEISEVAKIAFNFVEEVEKIMM